LTDDMPLAALPDRLPRTDGHNIAYHRQEGLSPALLFCGGFSSDMTGTKALALEEHCRRTGRGYVRFDYFGHGQSSGDFAEGTVGRWAEDTIAVLDEVCQGPQVIVGSSMGGWIMLLAALARPERVAGLVGVAAAADFTEVLMWERASPEVRHALETKGVWRQPSAYGQEPYPITMKLIADGRRHLLLDRPIPLACPVRLLHGMRDPDVPWQHGVRLVDALAGGDVTLTLIKDGDHRLSRPQDIARLIAMAEELCAEVR
jgi:pimeloyl-ACP methyl ester carboxylesterase